MEDRLCCLYHHDDHLPTVVNSISVFTNPVTGELGFSPPSFLIYFTIMSFSSVLSASFVGVMFRKYKASYVMALGVGLVALSLIGFSQAKSLMHFYLLAILQGIGLSTSCIVPPSVLITNWFTEKRGTALGLALAGAGIGGALFSPTATWLILDYGWRTAYLAAGLLMLLLTIPIVLLLVRFQPADMGQEPLGGVATSGQEVFDLSHEKMIKTPSFILMALSILFAGLMINGLLINFAPYIQMIGYSAQRDSFILSFSLFFMTVGKVLLGRLFDRIGPQQTFIAILASSLLCLVSLILAKNFAFGLLYTVAFGLASANILITPAILTTLLFGPKEFSKKYGFVATFVALSAALVSLYTGYFTKSGESGYRLMLYSFILLSILNYVSMYLSLKLKPKF